MPRTVRELSRNFTLSAEWSPCNICVCTFVCVCVCMQIVAMMKAYMERSCCHDDDLMTQLSCLSEQLELTVTVEQIDSISSLLSDFAQLQIDRIHHAPR